MSPCFQGNSLLSRCIWHVNNVSSSSSGGSGGAGDDVGRVLTQVTPFIVHRLDMDTSGVCMFVKDRALVDGRGLQSFPISAQLELFCPPCNPPELMNVSWSCSS